jgi:hypothetical protein
MFKTDLSAERQGVWLQYAATVEIKIARAGGANKAFVKLVQRLAKPHRRSIQLGTMDEKLLESLFMEAYAKTILLDWKGVTKDIITDNDADAEEELPFNVENATAVLKALPDLFVDIQKASDDISLFRAEILEHDSGN